MAFGKRIRFFRKRSRLSGRALANFVGFRGKYNETRILRYERELMRPKAKITKALSDALGVVPEAIQVPDIDSFTGLMHTLFAIEDMYGLTVNTIYGGPCLFIPGNEKPRKDGLLEHLEEWCSVKMDLLYGRITKTQYDDWRYNYPRIERKKADNDVMYTPLEAVIE